jgi:hypothetical protein
MRARKHSPVLSILLLAGVALVAIQSAGVFISWRDLPAQVNNNPPACPTGGETDLNPNPTAADPAVFVLMGTSLTDRQQKCAQIANNCYQKCELMGDLCHCEDLVCGTLQPPGQKCTVTLGNQPFSRCCK